jgi:hypothetical protein
MKYLIDLETDDGIEIIDETAIQARMNEVEITIGDTIVATGVRTRFNSAGVIRPMSRGTEISLDIIDNTIKSIEDLLVDMKAERMTVIEHAYQNCGQYVHIFESGIPKMEVRDRPKPPVPVGNSKYPPIPDEDDDDD